MKAEMKDMQKELLQLSIDLEGMSSCTRSFRSQIFFWQSYDARGAEPLYNYCSHQV